VRNVIVPVAAVLRSGMLTLAVFGVGSASESRERNAERPEDQNGPNELLHEESPFASRMRL
jgi:hypothetical protein